MRPEMEKYLREIKGCSDYTIEFYKMVEEERKKIREEKLKIHEAHRAERGSNH